MFLRVMEAVLGRRLMWKVGRRIYLHARREGSLNIDTNGERLLQHALAARSAKLGAPLKIYDVGANHGQWSRAMLEEIVAAKAPRAHLTLFEPVPPIRPSLTRLSEEFAERADFEIVPQAVSDAPGKTTMVFTDVAAGNHHLASEQLSYAGEKIAVEVTTLDRFHAAAGDDLIDMVKIDAEGFDPRVVIGMEGLLAQQRVGVVQIEYSVLFLRSRAFLFDIFEIAARHGYAVALLTQAGFEIHPSWHADLEHFYLAPFVMIRDDFVGLLASRIAVYGDDNAHE